MTIAHYPQPDARTPVPGDRPVRGWLLLGLALLAGCASAPERKPALSPPPPRQAPAHYAQPNALSARSNEVLIRAIGLVGTPYRYGGNSPAGGFDCSGLVDFVFLDAAGLQLPRSTRELIDLRAQDVDRDELQPGDLVFFNPGGGRTSHIGIYVGEGRFVHAPSSGGTVRLDALASEYWQRAYVGAKRVLN